MARIAAPLPRHILKIKTKKKKKRKKNAKMLISFQNLDLLQHHWDPNLSLELHSLGTVLATRIHILPGKN